MERRTLLLKAWLGYVPMVTAGLLIAYTFQVYAYYRSLGGSVTIIDSAGIAMVDIALWLILSPLIIALYTELASKFSINVQAIIQFLAALGFAAGHVVLDGLVNVLLPSPFSGSFTDFMEIFLASKLLVNMAFYLIIVLTCATVDYRIRLAGMVARLERHDSKQVDLMLHDGHRRFRVPLAEILWIEAANNYIGVHTLAGTEIARDTLSRVQDLLPTKQFARVHRSAIVGIRHARSWQPLARGDGQLTLADGRMVRVSRRYRCNIQHWLEDRPTKS